MASVQIPPARSFAAQASSHLPTSVVDFFKLHSIPEPPVKSQEPPRKRARVSGPAPIQYIVLRRTAINITFPKEKGNSDPNTHSHSTKHVRIKIAKIVDHKYRILIKYRPSWREVGGPSWQQKSPITVLHTNLDAAELPLRDVELATEEDVKWTRSSGQGKLWTDATMTLHGTQDSDHLSLAWVLNWETTETPLHVPEREHRYMLETCLIEYLPGLSENNFSFGRQAESFYKYFHVPDKKDSVALSLRTPAVTATLYPYQKIAVQWLLKREGVQWSSSGGVVPFEEEEENLGVDGLPPSFTKVADADGSEFFFSSEMNLATKDVTPFRYSPPKIRGGLNCSEMGLGKTVETIALITLHKLSSTGQTKEVGGILPIRATLIVVPSPLLTQWISELDRHSPSLEVLHYEGKKYNKKLSSDELRQIFAAQDVVITTYDVLTSELHYALAPPDRSMRWGTKYERAKSPLPHCLWWRVCLDEAQMIEGGISAAAQVANIIPRVNVWGISGTPVKVCRSDLYALLEFLRFEPYSSIRNLCSHLASSPRSFARCFKKIALRHTKASISEELVLPPQKRFVITMAFTPIEEQHYQLLFQQMSSQIENDPYGTTVMRRWLSRLRLTCLYPEIGQKDNRRPGLLRNSLRTLDEMVVAMLENMDEKIQADERSRLISKLRRGQMLENESRISEALELWSRAKEESIAICEELHKQLEQENMSNEASPEPQNAHVDDHEEHRPESTKVRTLRNFLRSALEVQHMAVFFEASAFFQLREKAEADGLESKELEKNEAESYERAKSLRNQILQEISGKATRLMGEISKTKLTSIPEISSEIRGGSDLGSVVETLQKTSDILDLQAVQIVEWRDSLIELLTKPLLDDDDAVEISGDEYENSAKIQDEIVVLLSAIKALVSDRHELLSGQHNKRLEVEVKISLQLAKDGLGPLPEKMIELLDIRQALLPGEEVKTLRATIAEAESVVLNFRPSNTDSRSRAETAEDPIHKVQELLTLQTKVHAALELELELFTHTMKARVDFYKHLQQISDTVAPYKGKAGKAVFKRKVEEEEKLTTAIAAVRTRRRYFCHLKSETLSGETRVCCTCGDGFEHGVFTTCGHTFCQEDFKLWRVAHMDCGVCRQRLTSGDFFHIVCKSQVLQGQPDPDPGEQDCGTSEGLPNPEIYSQVSGETLTQINDIKLGDTTTFTTKVTTLVKHIIWLRVSDPGAKSIVFCQYKEFLDVLSLAFDQYKIGHDSITRKGGIDRFRDDPATEVLLLPARAHSSGLNLVNATHVFLCEPLLQTALELQAIARVDRIGQTRATTVWLYLIRGTVEENIYRLSLARRLEHADGQAGRWADNFYAGGTSDGLMMADPRAGEAVPEGELLECLLGARADAVLRDRRETLLGPSSSGWLFGRPEIPMDVMAESRNGSPDESPDGSSDESS